MSAPGHPGRRLARALAAATLAVALLAAGCGGDDEDTTQAGTGKSSPPPTSTVTVPARTVPERTGSSTAPERTGDSTAPAPANQGGGEKPASPEDQPGGAGDEEPVRSEVVLTGRGGRIGPVLVKVPPFVSIRVILHSRDGKPYLIRFGRRILKVGPRGARSSATFAGLRPGRRLAGATVSGEVVIEASAEPGP